MQKIRPRMALLKSFKKFNLSLIDPLSL